MEKDLIILAIYINISGLSHIRVQQIIQEFVKNYEDMYKDSNKDVKTYWFPTESETKVECVYPPPSIVGNTSVLENELLKIYKLIANSKNDEAKEIVRHIERKLKLSSIKNKIN
jgi:hypothetical protein